jgi:Tfp pilus assembly protein PilX
MKTPVKYCLAGTARNLDRLLKNNQACPEQRRRIIGYGRGNALKQRGVVLFFALIALLVMSLAAVALIRSVDTSTLIAGNLAFRQATASSGDAGVNAASGWLIATQVKMDVNGRAALADPGCPAACNDAFNITGSSIPGIAGTMIDGTACCLNNGYYSNADPAVSLTDGTGIQWDANDSALVGTDNSGNEVRYVIQRMCRTSNQMLNTVNCLFSGADLQTGPQGIPLPSNICDPAVSPGCPKAGQAAMYRITARVKGAKDTISYIQSFVY